MLHLLSVFSSTYFHLTYLSMEAILPTDIFKDEKSTETSSITRYAKIIAFACFKVKANEFLFEVTITNELFLVRKNK